MKKNSVDVYWAPAFDTQEDWTILYEDPKSLLSMLNAQREDNIDFRGSFFNCPSFTSTTKNIYVLNAPMRSHYKVQDDGRYEGHGEANINMFQRDHNTLHNQIIIGPSLGWVFFTEDDSLEMSLSAPYFSKAPHLQYGAIVPGSFDVGKWFRQLGLEFNLWEGTTDLIFEEGEPLAYVNFNTTKKVNLIRFDLTNKLKDIKQVTRTSSTWQPKRTLVQRYDLFKRSRLKDIILKEIKNNLV
jgi:hypothetical protein